MGDPKWPVLCSNPCLVVFIFVIFSWCTLAMCVPHQKCNFFKEYYPRSPVVCMYAWLQIPVFLCMICFQHWCPPSCGEVHFGSNSDGLSDRTLMHLNLESVEDRFLSFDTTAISCCCDCKCPLTSVEIDQSETEYVTIFGSPGTIKQVCWTILIPRHL